MVETAVRFQLEKTGRGVAVVALRIGQNVELGLADGDYIIMAFVASSKDFLVIDKRNDRKSQGRMAGFAHAAGRDMIQRFG